jgi:hypothetical protein
LFRNRRKRTKIIVDNILARQRKHNPMRIHLYGKLFLADRPVFQFAVRSDFLKLKITGEPVTIILFKIVRCPKRGDFFPRVVNNRRKDSAARRRDSDTRRKDSDTRRRDSDTRRRDSAARRSGIFSFAKNSFFFASGSQSSFERSFLIIKCLVIKPSGSVIVKGQEGQKGLQGRDVFISHQGTEAQSFYFLNLPPCLRER